jgi:hypothetical protein
MVLCSNKTCRIEWYHEQCVDNGAPDTTGLWFCPACRLLERDETQVRSEDVEEEREGGNREEDRGTEMVIRIGRKGRAEMRRSRRRERRKKMF